MSAPFERQVLAQPAEISQLTDDVLEYLAAAGVDTRAAHHVALAFDELLTNLGTHGNSAEKPATVRVVVAPDKVTAEIEDTGPAFDVREASVPNLSESIEDRAIGGLGLFLVRKFASDIGYERRGDANCTRFAIARNTARNTAPDAGS